MFGVGHDPGALIEVSRNRSITPTVAIDAHLAIAIKIIQQHVFARELMMVGSDILAEHDQVGITVAGGPSLRILERAEKLVVSAVFFDDVKHVFDGAGLANLVRNDTAASHWRLAQGL